MRGPRETLQELPGSRETRSMDRAKCYGRVDHAVHFGPRARHMGCAPMGLRATCHGLGLLAGFLVPELWILGRIETFSQHYVLFAHI